jgi:3,4-dihydroxy-2-butanone 4-phosphate synthase
MDTTESSTAFASVAEAIEDIRHGRFVVVVDAATGGERGR